MSITYSKAFAPTLLTTGAATLYTVPATPTTNLFRGAVVRLTNTGAAAVAVTLYAVPSGGTASATNAFYSGRAVIGHDYEDVAVPILAAGDFIQGLADTGAVVNIQLLAGALFA